MAGGEGDLMKTQRDHLNAYSSAHRDIQLSESAIGILEGVSGCNSIVNSLKQKQQIFLRRMDIAAEQLGAPYKKGGAA